MRNGQFGLSNTTKLARLPNVTAYILAGILIGPYVLNLVPQRIIDGTDFLSDIALAFIAFSTGEFFKLDILKRNGMKVVWITILEAVLASVFIFILTYFVLRLDLAFSIVLAALASATAPASTMMTIRQTGAKGDFVDTLLQVVALDDVVGLVLYSVAISIALASLSGASGFSFETLGKPVVLNLLVVGLGSLFGLFMKLLMPQKRSKDNKLIISVALLFAFCGVCALLDLSPLLGCMMMGTVYTNIADDDKLFKQLNYFSPPILLLFFVRSGMSFQLDALVSSSGNLDGVPLLVIGVSYFLVRILGKYAGAWLGCRLVKKDRLVRNYLGLALIPQAGRAIRIEFFGDEIDRISEINAVTGVPERILNHVAIYPASHYVASKEKMARAMKDIEAEMWEQVRFFEEHDKLLEAQRIRQRTQYDLEMLQEIGFCTGIENYSRVIAGRAPGTPPTTLLDYFPDDFILFVDESHVTLPQVRAMYNGDHARKKSLVDYGFRLPSAYDNRPLTFDEFTDRIHQAIYVSATPADYERSRAGQIAEQVIRPTGLLDPEVFVRPIEGQIDDLIGEINATTDKGERTLVTTLTKKMAEDLTKYLTENGTGGRSRAPPLQSAPQEGNIHQIFDCTFY